MPDSPDSESAPPYWVLISVLQSTQPLSSGLAMTLHHTAFELYRTGAGSAPLEGDLLSGRVTNLKKDALIGTIGGPVFEAEIETERGSGMVRFLLTRKGLELMNAKPPSSEKKPRYLN